MEVNKIYNADARNMHMIQDKSVNLILFSPPYWNLRDYGFEGQIGKGETYEEYLDSMRKVFKECFRVLKEGSYMAIVVGTVVSDEGMKFIPGDLVRLSTEVGFTFRKDIIWEKPRGTTKWQRGATQFLHNPYPTRFNTNINHEYILIFQKGNRQNRDYSTIHPFPKRFVREVAYSVWEIIPINSPKKDERHVAPFPEEIPKRIIKLFSFPDDIVLDPFNGCGTTCKVARQLGRRYIGIDKSEEYGKIAREKLRKIESIEKVKERLFAVLV